MCSKACPVDCIYIDKSGPRKIDKKTGDIWLGELNPRVTGASSMGRLKGTKTGAERTVRLLSPLAQDLAEWRLA